MKPLRNPFSNGRFANEKCFCGSGMKMKKCHGREYSVTEEIFHKNMELFKRWEDSPEAAKFFSDLRAKRKS